MKRNLRKWEVVACVAGIVALLFSVSLMAMEAFYDYWLFPRGGMIDVQLFLIIGMMLMSLFMFRLYECKKKKAIFIIAVVLLIATVFEVWAFLNMQLLIRIAL